MKVLKASEASFVTNVAARAAHPDISADTKRLIMAVLKLQLASKGESHTVSSDDLAAAGMVENHRKRQCEALK